jgi:hypothetical protein
MDWTTERPKPLATGYYWFCTDDHNHAERPFIVYVCFDGDIGNAYVQRVGLSVRIPLLEFCAKDTDEPETESYWYGPVRPPTR